MDVSALEQALPEIQRKGTMLSSRWEDVQALVEAAEFEDWTRPLAGATGILVEALRYSSGLPEGLLEDALATREFRFLNAVLANDAVELRTVLESGDFSVLVAVMEHAEGDWGLIAKLYGTVLSDERRDAVLACRQPDWAAITEAARGKVFGKDAAAAVAAHPGCPNELRDLLYARHPVAVAEHAAHLDMKLVTADCPKRSRPKAVRILVRRGLGRGIGGAALLTEARPAMAVLEAMRVSPEGSACVEREEFGERLGALVQKRLGEDVGAWRTVRARLRDFPGTVPELLAAAADAPSGGGWPDAAGFPETSATSSLAGVRAAFVTLLDAAGDTAHDALLPHLDERTLHDLYHFCAWRPAWPAQARKASVGGTNSPVDILIGSPGLTTEAVEELLTVETLPVLTALSRKPVATSDQRARIHSVLAARFTSTRFTKTPFTKKKELTEQDLWHFGGLFECTDPRHFRTLLLDIKILGRIPQLHMFLHVWRKWGAAEVAALLKLRPVIYSTYEQSREVIKDLLTREDREAALAELAEQVTTTMSPQGQIAMWRTRKDRAAMIGELNRWHWPELLAEHRREPFHSDLIGVLPRLPDCPEEFRSEARTILLSWECKQYGLLMSGTPAEEVLARFDAGKTDSQANKWLGRAVSTGHVSWEQALRHGHPAIEVLRQLPDCFPDGRKALAALMRDTLKNDADAWLLALGMLPDFPGTVAELLRTAALAADVA